MFWFCEASPHPREGRIWPPIPSQNWTWRTNQSGPTALGMKEHHDLDTALLRWLEAKLANSDDETYHEHALNYVIGLVLSGWDAQDAAALAPVT